MNNELSVNEIPQGVLDELTTTFGEFTLALDSDINKETKTLKVDYVETANDEPVEMTALDPVTFKPTKFMAIPQQTFMVRININDNDVIVRRVLDSGLVAQVPVAQ